MKSKLRIPTAEQFAFIEVDFEGTPQETVSAYREITDMVQSKYGMERLEFNKVLDKYLETNTMTSEQYEEMSNRQKDVIQELKKAFKRLKPNDE